MIKKSKKKLHQMVYEYCEELKKKHPKATSDLAEVWIHDFFAFVKDNYLEDAKEITEINNMTSGGTTQNASEIDVFWTIK